MYTVDVDGDDGGGGGGSGGGRALMSGGITLAPQASKGIFGFGARKLWLLPAELLPLAAALYHLQRGQLLDAKVGEASPLNHSVFCEACMLVLACVQRLVGQSDRSSSPNGSRTDPG